LPSDNSKFYEYSKTNKGPYIIKPEAGAQGKGIFLVNKYEEIP
jgi:glutathione synthase/RimK-type ligase-like ATP-grasp enzyme